MLNVFSENDLEILIATKNRSNFDFLLKMFPHQHFSNFSLLIINQSQNDFLSSDFECVKVINSKEKGLSKSRNLAIGNASKKICLIADDDVIFEKDFSNNIVLSFNQHQNAHIITFNHKRIGNPEPQKKRNSIFIHDTKSIWNVSSIEIAFKLDEIKNRKLHFDENFGLGSHFETAEEFLFLKEALNEKLRLIFNPAVIVSHAEFSSGKNEGSDALIYARAALFYKLHGIFAYVWLLKYILFLTRKKYIKFSDALNKYKKGMDGIIKFKQLTHNRK